VYKPVALKILRMRLERRQQADEDLYPACVHNTSRSQMSAVFFNEIADTRLARAISAGRLAIGPLPDPKGPGLRISHLVKVEGLQARGRGVPPPECLNFVALESGKMGRTIAVGHGRTTE
jgi:hypothetical protein